MYGRISIERVSRKNPVDQPSRLGPRTPLTPAGLLAQGEFICSEKNEALTHYAPAQTCTTRSRRYLLAAPAAILLDLMMPKFSGFELCQSFHSLSYTSLIPIFVITGESAARYKEHCEGLGAKGFFEKPVDYKELKTRLALELGASRPERRSHVRGRMRVILKLCRENSQAESVEVQVATEM